MSHRPTPALVISIVALFVAMGGTGYAASQIPRGSVGAAQLKKNAVSSPKVKNGSLALNDFKIAERTKLRGSAGARGAAGARGSQGLGGSRGLSGLEGDEGADGSDGGQGIQGIPGPTGVEQVVVRTGGLVFAAGAGGDGQVLTTDVQCQAGESVVGGGTDIFPTVAVTNQPNTIIIGSRPADPAGTPPTAGMEPTGWFVQARRNSQTSGQTVNVFVLCASAGA
jgi:hypothetical protein